MTLTWSSTLHQQRVSVGLSGTGLLEGAGLPQCLMFAVPGLRQSNMHAELFEFWTPC